MAAFESVVRFLESLGVFTYLAHLLLFIILYYGLLYLLVKHVESARLTKGRKDAIAFIASGFITCLTFYYFSSYVTEAGAVIGAAVFLFATLFILAAVGFKLGGIDIPSLFRKEPA